jgi:hypothetical protein
MECKDTVSAAAAGVAAVGLVAVLRMMLRATGFMVFKLDVAEPSDEDEGIFTMTGFTALPVCFAKSTDGTGGVLPLVPTETMAALPPMI